MALIHLTLNVDRLATAIETALPTLERIAAALDRAFPPVLTRQSNKPAGVDAHHRVDEHVLRRKREQDAADRVSR